MAKTAAGIVPFIDLDPSRSVSLHRQIYEGFRQAILSGRLAPGVRLASTRALAADLGVSRMTVVVAFRQLQAEGYLDARVGAGTYVSANLPEETLRSPPGPVDGDDRRDDLSAAPALSRRGSRSTQLAEPRAGPEESRPLFPGIPALEAFPSEPWRALAGKVGAGASAELLGYGDPAGHGPLREAIAVHLRVSRGVECDGEQVVITGGSQQAIRQLAHLLLDPGDRVWVEDPGYINARQALMAAGAEPVPVPVDESGLNVEAGRSLAPRARVAYVTPSHQFPLGGAMGLDRRLALLRWARRVGAWVLEDDYDSEYRFVGRPLQSLQGLDRGRVVVYMGTFSKILFPALRLGYLVLPRPLLEPYVAGVAVNDGPPPTLPQVVAAEFIRAGHFARHIRRMRSLYAERRDVLVEALRSELDGLIEIGEAEAGMHLHARLPEGLDDRRVYERAAADGVTAFPLSRFCAAPATRGGLVLGYGAFRQGEIRRAVRIVATAIRAEL